MGDVIKVIDIIGTGQRYQMKNAMKVPKQIIALKTVEKIRDEPAFSLSLFLDNNQKDHLIHIMNKTIPPTAVSLFIEKQLKKKIASYKQQDIIKKRLDHVTFVTLEEVVDMMNQTELHCHYCCEQMYILYEFAREKKQWTLDRIDNQLGHISTNIVLSCLECNLKRRRIRKDAFLFTKNMKIVRINIDND